MITGPQLLSWAFEALKLSSGFVVGALVVYLKTRNDLLHKYIDDAESVVREFADTACRYWSLPASDPECLPLEVKIRQLSNRIGVELRYINAEFRRADFSDWYLLTTLRKKATGGSFGQRTRTPDKHLAGDIDEAANNLISAIRKMRPGRFF